MKTYTPDLGESINEAIENALTLSSRKKCDISFKFNGLELQVNSSITDEVDYYLGTWKVLCKESSAAYKASSEYKVMKEKQEKARDTLQGELDNHIEHFCDKGATPYYMASWLKRFVELSDHVDVNYDRECVLLKLQEAGYKENEYVGYNGGWTPKISVKYIAGQVINCLNSIGLIPPVCITMCEKVLNDKSL